MVFILLPFWQAYMDKAFSNEILALDVKCKNNEWGCKWEGEFQNYQVNTLWIVSSFLVLGKRNISQKKSIVFVANNYWERRVLQSTRGNILRTNFSAVKLSWCHLLFLKQWFVCFAFLPCGFLLFKDTFISFDTGFNNLLNINCVLST